MFSAEVCIASQKDGAEELADNNKNFSSVILIIKTSDEIFTYNDQN